MHKYLILFLSILLMTCSESKDSSLLESIILSLENDFPSIVLDPEKHRLQVLYTQIDRDENNYPKFTTHKFRLRPREYFYPASTTKFPIAVLALEKANQNSKINPHTRLEVLIGSLFGPAVALPGIIFIGSPLHLLQIMGLITG